MQRRRAASLEHGDARLPLSDTLARPANSPHCEHPLHMFSSTTAPRLHGSRDVAAGEWFAGERVCFAADPASKVPPPNNLLPPLRVPSGQPCRLAELLCSKISSQVTLLHGIGVKAAAQPSVKEGELAALWELEPLPWEHFKQCQHRARFVPGLALQLAGGSRAFPFGERRAAMEI